MSEIKFRAWDKNNNEMVEVANIDYGAYKTKIEYLTVEYKNGETLTEYADSFELMQYTGLKDKNGKEIYEGDIVEYSRGFFGATIYKQVVKFSDGMFIPLVIVEEGYNCIDEYQRELFEVIGNKYENPELLEADNHE